MSFNIMTALIHCTPSISKEVGVAYYYECGPSLVVCLAACQALYRCVVGSVPAHSSNLIHLLEKKCFVMSV